MEESRKSGLVFGIILVALGFIFLAFQLFPVLREYINWSTGWPLIIVGIGVAFLISAVIWGVPGMAIPAAIVGGIGCLLWWQNATNHWETWAYAWALIPGFVGIGIILDGLVRGRLRETVTGGMWLIFISLVLFFIFGSFLGGLELFGAYWPILLIGLGLFVLLRPLLQIRLR